MILRVLIIASLIGCMVFVFSCCATLNEYDEAIKRCVAESKKENKNDYEK